MAKKKVLKKKKSAKKVSVKAAVKKLTLKAKPKTRVKKARRVSVKAAVKKTEALPLVNFKASRKDIKIIETLAKKYLKGNRSAWIRFAATKFKPSVRSVKLAA